MTISSLALSQTLDGQILAQQQNISQLEEQISSGQALNQPSDNPTAVTQVLGLSSQVSQLTAMQTNAQQATSWLGTATSTANNVLNEMNSAQTLLLQAANSGTQSPTSYKAIGQQIQGIVANLVSLANTQYDGRAIFAGTSASSEAFDSSGNYLGNTDTPTVVIGPGAGVGQSIALSVPGTALFGTGAANVFATLTAVETELSTGAPTAANISAALAALGTNISGAQQASASLGTASQQASGATSTLTKQIATLQTSQANLEDVNVATATTQLSQENTTYQAALWAASQTIPETLLKFVAP